MTMIVKEKEVAKLIKMLQADDSAIRAIYESIYWDAEPIETIEDIEIHCEEKCKQYDKTIDFFCDIDCFINERSAFFTSVTLNYDPNTKELLWNNLNGAFMSTNIEGLDEEY